MKKHILSHSVILIQLTKDTRKLAGNTRFGSSVFKGGYNICADGDNNIFHNNNSNKNNSGMFQL